MSFANFHIVGDNIELNGEVVATLKHDARASLRGELEEAIEMLNDCEEITELEAEIDRYKKVLEDIRISIDELD